MRLLLMSHGNMAIETLKSAEMILGHIDNMKAIGLQPNQGPEDLQKAAEEFINDNLIKTRPWLRLICSAELHQTSWYV